MIIPPKWMRKANDFLILIWFFIPIAITVCILFAAHEFFVNYNEDNFIIWINFACLYGIIWIVPVITNILISIVEWIIEKIHFIRLDRYYKKYPEKEKENNEKLAKDFEEIAKIIRGEDKDDNI